MSELNQTLGTRRRIALVALGVATLIVLGWTFWPQADEKAPPVTAPPVQRTVAPQVLKPAQTQCSNPATRPFRPTKITIAGITKNAEVLQLGRDSNNVPRAADLTTAGKTQFAWDDPEQATPGLNDTVKPTGAYPGSQVGNVLLNAHTWPDGQTPALGNFLLADLGIGDTIVVEGKNAELCYRVTKKSVIEAADGSADYYVNDGPPQLALIVCSPPRLGPGNWVNRTIWYAEPITA